MLLAHQTIAEGDAIGNDISGMVEVLTANGFLVRIVADFFNYSALEELRASENDIKNGSLLIYHHSIYWQRGEEVFRSFRGKKIFRYHNITPSQFFVGYSPFYLSLTEKGKKQTSRLVKHADLCLADSQYNANELLSLGVRGDLVKVLPPLHHIEKFEEVSAEQRILNELFVPELKVLTVGRISPNKGLLDVVKVAAAYKQLFGESAVFYLVGSFDDQLASYTRELLRAVEKFDLSRMVRLTGKVSLPELKAYYKGCDLYLCLSQHEGFCVPIIEAQSFGLPVVALAFSAVPETIGAGQLLFNELDHLQIAAALHVVTKNNTYKSTLIKRGFRNVQRFKLDFLKTAFWNKVKELMYL
ncbi:glycosyltransferase [Neomoorella thermoacetica]|uniref:glycosyltransferase n=1 Tax=Neomoorella thermoacetica TaxID=1525 RepID=UPI0018C89D91|nr:glycosyltransferase [Moorella thermoacetica]